jgi:hypothetical protein
METLHRFDGTRTAGPGRVNVSVLTATLDRPAPGIARAMAPRTSASIPSGLLTTLSSLPYRLGLGRLLGHRFLLLTFEDGAAAPPRRRLLEVVSWDDDRSEAVVIAPFGARSAWFQAALAGRAVECRIDAEVLRPLRARRVEGEEAYELFSAFERRNRLLMPLARPFVSRLAGFHYDGSPGARRRLLRTMPLLGLAGPLSRRRAG